MEISYEWLSLGKDLDIFLIYGLKQSIINSIHFYILYRIFITTFQLIGTDMLNKQRSIADAAPIYPHIDASAEHAILINLWAWADITWMWGWATNAVSRPKLESGPLG